MNPKKHLSFGSLVYGFRQAIEQIPESQCEKVDYPLADIVFSAFACMYFQDQSLLQFQKHLEDHIERSNLTTLFGVAKIPESPQLREGVQKPERTLYDKDRNWRVESGLAWCYE